MFICVMYDYKGNVFFFENLTIIVKRKLILVKKL